MRDSRILKCQMILRDYRILFFSRSDIVHPDIIMCTFWISYRGRNGPELVFVLSTPCLPSLKCEYRTGLFINLPNRHGAGWNSVYVRSKTTDNVTWIFKFRYTLLS